ncbi:hypothetical protein M427DRAFT_113310 [Gonapodya prolifera JEL478]|uniref:Uncharacterized protein n=1 Tax=Gonapodya prolifera (strain JEL478) TaxID=1344416 RepID=A0A139A9Z7_GONPJ|nr:hypothetical protein M427DRAFT_113310 [Gonapodya prolifera JEL478]|eukprot:KXS13509.1 hypothetical protein M427DRAFT_113310 [Gonapodya prolifera JEL478]
MRNISNTHRSGDRRIGVSDSQKGGTGPGSRHQSWGVNAAAPSERNRSHQSTQGTSRSQSNAKLSPVKRPRTNGSRFGFEVRNPSSGTAPIMMDIDTSVLPRSVLPSPERKSNRTLTPPPSGDSGFQRLQDRPIANQDVPTLKELDAEEEGDPCKVREYADAIVCHLRMLDECTQPSPAYILRQPHLTFAMRSVLVDWLSEVHSQCGFVPETLLLAVNLLDRFLSETRCNVSSDRFQLLGIACLLIACKYEEVNPPKIAFLLNICNNAYTRRQLKDAELFVLTTLHFDVSSFASPLNFLRRISRAEGYDPMTRTLGKYLVELCAADGDCIGEKNGVIAAACAWLARVVMGRVEWTDALVDHSGYSPENKDLQRVARILQNHLCTGVKAPSIRAKYSSPEYMSVAIQVDNWSRVAGRSWTPIA